MIKLIGQVSIAGEMSGVERARARVRKLTPLLFNFDLPIVPSFQQAPDTNSPFLRAIQVWCFLLIVQGIINVAFGIDFFSKC